MAKNRFVRWLSIQWDRDAARRLQSEAAASLDKAGDEGAAKFEAAMKVGGAKGARALTTELQRQFKLRQARLSQQLADGTINERDFRREGEKAAREFNAGLTQGIQRLRTSTGGLTDAQFVGLGSRYKSTGAGMKAGAAALLATPFFAPIAALLTAQEGLRQARGAIEAADELANSIQKLGGTAKITGLDLAFLESTAARAKDQFRLSTPIANDLTTEVAKLATKAGDISKTSQALESFLDIGAARGLTASQTLQAVGQAILGIDEGTDKLFSKNPSTIYEEWARRIGRTAESLSDQEKATALLDATLAAGDVTRGEYLRWQEGAQGKAAVLNDRFREQQAEIGKLISPLRELTLELKVGFYEALVKVAGAVGGLAQAWQDYRKATPTAADLAALSGEVWNIPANTQFSSGARQRMGMGDVRAADRALDLRTPPPPPDPPTPGDPNAVGNRSRAWLQSMGAILGPAQAEALQEAEKNARALKEQAEAMWRAMNGEDAVPERSDAGQEWADRVQREMERIDNIATDVAGSVTDAWQDAFSLMIEEGATVGNFFEGLGRGIAGSLGTALAQFAAGEAKKHFASAIGAAAFALGFSSHGNFASATAAWSSAAQHTAAGLAFSAIAGGSAAGAGAARTRSPGSTFDQGLSTARNSIGNGVGPEVTIIFNGPDELNPEFERTIYGATERARERYGDNAKITVRRNAA